MQINEHCQWTGVCVCVCYTLVPFIHNSTSDLMKGKYQGTSELDAFPTFEGLHTCTNTHTHTHMSHGNGLGINETDKKEKI